MALAACNACHIDGCDGCDHSDSAKAIECGSALMILKFRGQVAVFPYSDDSIVELTFDDCNSQEFC
jgi:hypothetical protein